jgi:hypothetical protein
VLDFHDGGAKALVFEITSHAVPTVFCIVVGAGGLAALLTRFVSDLHPAVTAADPRAAH